MISNLSKNVFFAGIGGIGMSALARFLRYHEHTITGYDRTETDLTRDLIKEGINVYYTEEGCLSYLTSETDFIYTPAISNESLLRIKSKELKLNTYKRSQILGKISQNFCTIAVAGTHGKTSVSAMTAHLLTSEDKIPTAFIGGISKNLNTNLLIGNSEQLVVEADEYDRSFLTLFPEIAILTALDPDHLDIYGTESEMLRCYEQFVKQIRSGGTLLIASELKPKIAIPSGLRTYTYGNSESDDFSYHHIRTEGTNMCFNVKSSFGTIRDLNLQMPGEHNIKNMTAGIAVSLLNGFSFDHIIKKVDTFSGIKRRFEIIIDSPKITLIDDYAHHPAEIKAAIQAARHLFPERQLVAVFQPHLFTRTRDFYPQFARALSEADLTILTHIYPAREQPLPNVTCETIYNAMDTTKPKYILTLNQIIEGLHEYLTLPSAVLILGAGDIDKTVIPLSESFRVNFQL